jgi:NADPH-dependent curcumin reductase CurA
MLATAVDALATKGRLIIIGMMSAYQQGWKPSVIPGLAEKLLWKSAACVGFFLPQYAGEFRRHLGKLFALVDSGRLQVPVERARTFRFEETVEAVEWLQSGKSAGKVFVSFPGAAEAWEAAGGSGGAARARL